MGDHGSDTALARLLSLRIAGRKPGIARAQKALCAEFGRDFSKTQLKCLLARVFWEDDAAPKRISDTLPIVSIIVPVYGTEPYLQDCLTSLCSQSLREIEIIVVDDHSPDFANDIVLDFQLRDERILYVRNRRNRGLFRTRQSGVRFSSGKYIAHLDSDDFVEPKAYEQAVGRAVETSADIVQFSMKRLKERQCINHRASHAVHDQLEAGEILQAFLRREINFSVCNKLYASELWRRAAKFFPRRSYMVEDLSQNLPIMQLAKKYASLPDVLHTYRITPNSDSRSRDPVSLGFRAFSAARHLAALKRRLAQDASLERHWPLIGSFERLVYEDYIFPLVRYFGNLPKSTRKQKRLTKAAFARIARINGHLALTPWIRSQPELLKFLTNEPRKKRPAVSLIIPVYNGAGYLGDCLNSVLSQTLKSLEIIIVDDGSSDRTGQLIAEWGNRDKRIRTLTHTKNRGLLQSRLSGARIAQGRYIAHLDVDDQLDPSALKTLYTCARKTRAEIVQCGYLEVQAENTRKVLCRNIPRIESEDIFERFLQLDGVSNAMWNKLYASSLYRRALVLMTEENHLAEDFYQNTILTALAGNFEHVGEPLYHYTVRQDSGDHIQSAERICRRAVSACHHIQLATYVASLQRYPDRFRRALQARRRGYLSRMLTGLARLSERDPLGSSVALAECYTITGWSLNDQMNPLWNVNAPPPGHSANLNGVDGVCERVRDGFARGWLVDQSDYTRCLAIDVYWNQQKVLTLPAQNYRKDLEKVGWGDGLHGFYFACPDAEDGDELLICISGTTKTLRKTPVCFEGGEAILGDDCPRGEPRKKATIALQTAESEPRGRLKDLIHTEFRISANCRLHGTIRDTKCSEKPIEIDAYWDGILLPETQVRSSGQGEHDFKLTLPDLTGDPREHEVRICLKDTLVDLPGSPLKIRAKRKFPFVG